MSEAIQARLAAAVRRHLGAPGEICQLVRLTGGATKLTWSFDAVVGDQTLPLILQHTGPDATEGSQRVLGANDAALLEAARRAGVPVPRVCFVLGPDDELGDGTVTERISGETLGRKIHSDPRLAGARPALAGQCGEILAAIHRIDAAGVGFLVAQTAAAQVASYRAIADSCEHPLPAVEYGLRWVAEHLPADERATVVHGDFRNGNLIVGGDGVRCVLDWELAQIGDPMLDLGWLCVKTWRFGGALPVGGFGHRDELFRAYEHAGGGTVDPGHVRFWEAFGSIKWAIMCMHKGLGPLGGAPRTVEAVAIGRRIEEPLLDFLDLITGKDG